jgi:O-antigen/teichoic acid export membrane protein
MGDSPTPSSARFLTNILWSWAGVAANLALGVLLSPYMLRLLGAEAYGIWALVFSLVEYFWVIDAGMRSAVVYFLARDRALAQADSMRATLSSALAVYTAVALLASLLTLALAHFSADWFHINPALTADYTLLTLLTGLSWALGCLALPWRAALEAFELFPVVNRIWIASLLLRVAGSFAVLALGYRLPALGAVSFATQLFVAIASVLAFHRAEPALTLSPALLSRARLTEMARYGAHTLLSTLSQLGLRQGPPVLIGLFYPTAYVGYFALPSRLMEYIVDAVSRVGVIANPNTAALAARGDTSTIARQGIWLNRYCFCLFAPFALFLLTFGDGLIAAWMPAFAPFSTPLLLPLVLGTAFAVAGQYVSASLLFGLAQHRIWARLLLLETALLLPTAFWVLPRHGLVGLAWTATVLMIAIRGLAVPWFLTHHLNFSFPRFIVEIYARPLAVALPLGVAAYALRQTTGWGQSLFEVALAGLLIAASFSLAALVFCIDPSHRSLLLQRLQLDRFLPKP